MWLIKKETHPLSHDVPDGRVWSVSFDCLRISMRGRYSVALIHEGRPKHYIYIKERCSFQNTSFQSSSWRYNEVMKIIEISHERMVHHWAPKIYNSKNNNNNNGLSALLLLSLNFTCTLYYIMKLTSFIIESIPIILLLVAKRSFVSWRSLNNELMKISSWIGSDHTGPPNYKTYSLW